jgi:hypothetical protein
MAFSNAPVDKLYGLLPAHIRERDAEAGESLRALLRIIESSTDAIEADLAQLHANAFIETCEPWAIPYIGDLVGWTPIDDGPRPSAPGTTPNTADELFRDLAGPVLAPPPPVRARADVAKTIYYRRRKGTLPMLEELARDVTGWSAHAVEFFELLGWTQWLRNHIRPHAVRTPDLRSVERMTRLDGAFDEVTHTVSVRPIGQREGWHNIANIGFFLWRLLAHRLEDTQARRLGAAGDFRFYFSVLGQDAPLFSRARREGDEAGLATELHVPQPIRPARLFADLQAYQALPVPRPGFTDFYGLFDAVPGFNLAPAPSFAIIVDGTPVAADDIHCANLSAWARPAGPLVAVDPVRGRLALGTDYAATAEVRVYHHAGFPAHLGGGPYRRTAWLMRRDLVELTYRVNASGAPGIHASIAAAIAQWSSDGGPDAVISVEDNRTYTDALAIDVAPAAGALLAIEAADGFRPHLRLDQPLVITGERDDFSITLSGLLVEGAIALEGSLRRLRFVHTTLVPGRAIAEPDPDLGAPPPPPPTQPSLIVAAADANNAPHNTELAVELAFAIAGPLHVPAHAEAIRALDSIVDGVGEPALRGPEAGDAPCAPLHLERSTIVGPVLARAMTLASECIFTGLVTSDRVGIGCVRFSYVVPGSRTPRRYRCQPDLAERVALQAAPVSLTPAEWNALIESVRRRIVPAFTDDDYGRPAYLQLTLSTPPEITEGAEDGAEMGVYAHLRQPQRAANLRVRLEEYLPFGLDAGLVFVT